MNEQINTELLKLQEELGTLDTAVKEISKAGKISENLISSTQNIHESYQEQLNKIQRLYSEFLNKTYNHTEKNISKIFSHFQDKIREEEKILEKYTELSIQTEDLTHDYLKNNFSENKKQILGLIKDADKNFEGQRNIIDLHAQSIDKKISAVIKSHEERFEKEEKILSNYVELAQLTAQLTEHLKTIDFPERLDKIKKTADDIEKRQKLNEEKINKLSNDETTKQILTKVEKLLKDNKFDEILNITKKQKRKANITNILLTIVLITNMIIYTYGGILFFGIFKDFIEAFF